MAPLLHFRFAAFGLHFILPLKNWCSLKVFMHCSLAQNQLSVGLYCKAFKMPFVLGVAICTGGAQMILRYDSFVIDA